MEKMDWLKLLSRERFSLSDTKDHYDFRTESQRDIDRIVFSSAFRRLQNKTQVFPLPTNDFVRNRLTHTLEVAQVGRALGVLAGNKILEEEIYLNGSKDSEEEITYTENDIGDIVAAACLAHDLGNPPFGHSGEDAIGHYFRSEKGGKYIVELNEAMKNDFMYFEGNAAGLRILTNKEETGFEGGLRLSYTTLGTFIKYPTNSIVRYYEDPDDPEKSTTISKQLPLTELGRSVDFRKSLKKYNYFQTERDTFDNICCKCSLIRISDGENLFGNTYIRHPLNFIMEAADTICYKLIDVEDGTKVRLINAKKVNEILNNIIKKSPIKMNQSKLNHINSIKDVYTRIGPLTKGAIRSLVYQCGEVFKKEYGNILLGKYDQELTEEIPTTGDLHDIEKLCHENLYNQPSILEVELAGFEVMGGLLDFFLEAVFDNESKKSKKAIQLLPKQFQIENRGKSSKEDYDKIMGVVDFVSRMTDNYAMSMYKKVKGIESPLY